MHNKTSCFDTGQIAELLADFYNQRYLWDGCLICRKPAHPHYGLYQGFTLSMIGNATGHPSLVPADFISQNTRGGRISGGIGRISGTDLETLESARQPIPRARDQGRPADQNASLLGESGLRGAGAINWSDKTRKTTTHLDSHGTSGPRLDDSATR